MHSSDDLNLLALPSHPPYQNREQPPYSVSKNHLTVYSRHGPFAFGVEQASVNLKKNVYIYSGELIFTKQNM